MINQFFKNLEQEIDCELDLKLIEEVMVNEMFLGELNLNMGFKKKDMKVMIKEISKGLKNFHTIQDFLHTIPKNNLKKLNKKQKRQMTRLLHYMLVLDRLTQIMSEDLELMKRVKDYYLSQRKLWLKSKGIKQYINMLKAVGASKTLKVSLIDKAFSQYLDYREKGIQKGTLLHKNLGLLANIKWAGNLDKKNGYTENAKVGNQFLTRKRFSTKGLVQKIEIGDKKRVVQHFPKNWTNLYHSWNLAFVLGSMDHQKYFVAKLAIPTVLNSAPKYYLMTRTMALWVTSNIVLGHMIKGRKGVRIFGKKLIKDFGAINLAFATNELGGK